MYNNTGGTYSQCGWTAVAPTGYTCSVCIGLLGTCAAGICLCLGTTYTGYEAANFQIIQCNLDDYSMPLIAATGIFGLLAVRRRNKR